MELVPCFMYFYFLYLISHENERQECQARLSDYLNQIYYNIPRLNVYFTYLTISQLEYLI